MPLVLKTRRCATSILQALGKTVRTSYLYVNFFYASYAFSSYYRYSGFLNQISMPLNVIISSLGRMTGSMDILCVALFGEATSESRDRLFSNNSTVEVKDDAGQLISSHPDWEEQTYAEIIEAFSEEDDHVYLPRIVTGMKATLAFESSEILM